MDGALVSHGLYFYGARFELRNGSVLAVMPNLKVGKVVFDGCSIVDTNSSGTRNIVSVGAYASLTFRECEFPSNGGQFTYTLTGNTLVAESGRLVFDSCMVTSGLSNDILFTSSYGRATAINCHPMDYGAVVSEPFIVATDFDLGASGASGISGYRDANTRTKRVFMKANNTIWPKSNGSGGSANDLTIKLPKKAIIKSIILRKSAGGSSFAPYTLQVTNNDKTVVHATSNTADQLYAHSITFNDYYYDVGDTDNERIIRVSVTAGTTGNANLSGGFGFIEYL